MLLGCSWRAQPSTTTCNQRFDSACLSELVHRWLALGARGPIAAAPQAVTLTIRARSGARWSAAHGATTGAATGSCLSWCGARGCGCRWSSASTRAAATWATRRRSPCRAGCSRRGPWTRFTVAAACGLLLQYKLLFLLCATYSHHSINNNSVSCSCNSDSTSSGMLVKLLHCVWPLVTATRALAGGRAGPGPVLHGPAAGGRARAAQPRVRLLLRRRGAARAGRPLAAGVLRRPHAGLPRRLPRRAGRPDRGGGGRVGALRRAALPQLPRGQRLALPGGEVLGL